MNKLKYLSILLMALLLGACGGSGDDSLTGGTGGGGGADPGDVCEFDPPENEDCIPQDVIEDPTITVMGNGVGVDFAPEAINVGLANLSAGGSTLLEVTIVHQDDTSVLYTDEAVDVVFSSPCVAQGLAAIDPASVSTLTGTAQATYTATGCTGDDVISANAVVESLPVSATGGVTIAPADVNSISFISADPELIGLEGTGGLGFDETSEVTFQIVDDVGNPVSGVEVAFNLSTTVGGITFSPDTSTSDANGHVQTVVTSGTVATTVRVTATVVGSVPTVATQSSGLVISTGLPDQDSFTWSVQCPNIEAWQYNGVENDVTVQMADRFQNPVPDDTSVSFNAEGGSIESSCSTVTTDTQSGFCVVTWTSSNPRPDNGRVTVLAHAIGEESFTDANGNGVFDDGDVLFDIPEIYRDDNENGVWNATVDGFFLDFDSDNNYDSGDGLFNGILCQDSTRCGVEETLGVGESGIIIMSGSHPEISDNLGGFKPVGGAQQSQGTLVAPGSVSFTIGDLHDQPMPAGTTVSLETDVGKIIGPDTVTTGCTSNDGPLVYSFAIDSNDVDEDKFGTAVLTVETPGPGVGTIQGVTTTYFLTISDLAPVVPDP